VSTDITDRKQREEQVELLMHELSHRTKNLLAVIQSLVRQLTRQSSDMSDFETRFMARIGALARAHDLLVQRHWQGTPLADVAKTQLFAFVGHESSRVIFDGPNVMLRPETVQNLSLVMHELATNAAKYGALSTPGGRIVITWTPADDALTFCWREEGGPPVTAPTRRGFGHTVITRMLAQGSEPNVSFEFPREGVRVTLRIPYDQIAQEPTVAV
jgi:two-component sensor histidine kinase